MKPLYYLLAAAGILALIALWVTETIQWQFARCVAWCRSWPLDKALFTLGAVLALLVCWAIETWWM